VYIKYLHATPPKTVHDTSEVATPWLETTDLKNEKAYSPN